MNLSEIPKLVINLPSRPERLVSFREQFKYIDQGGDTYEVMPGIIADKPLRGIGQAHINCIKKAIEQKWKQVMILEDDVIFQAQNKTIEFVQNALHNLPERWDLLLSGVYQGRRNHHANRYWTNINGFCGLHCYIVNESFYHTFLTWPGNQHIDIWLGRNSNAYVASKFFAIQSPGLSDNTGKHENYDHRLNKFTLL